MVGDSIQRIRRSRNLTQQELASRLNVTRATVSAWELNRNEPNFDMIIKISKVLDCVPAEIAFDYNPDEDYSYPNILEHVSAYAEKIINDDESRLVKTYSKLSPEKQALVLNYAIDLLLEE